MDTEKPSLEMTAFQPCEVCPVEELCVPERRCRHHSSPFRSEAEAQDQRPAKLTLCLRRRLTRTR